MPVKRLGVAACERVTAGRGTISAPTGGRACGLLVRRTVSSRHRRCGSERVNHQLAFSTAGRHRDRESPSAGFDRESGNRTIGAPIEVVFHALAGKLALDRVLDRSRGLALRRLEHAGQLEPRLRRPDAHHAANGHRVRCRSIGRRDVTRAHWKLSRYAAIGVFCGSSFESFVLAVACASCMAVAADVLFSS